MKMLTACPREAARQRCGLIMPDRVPGRDRGHLRLPGATDWLFRNAAAAGQGPAYGAPTDQADLARWPRPAIVTERDWRSGA